MNLISAMPSPTNTNWERLFILRGSRANPLGAYDSRRSLRGMAFDDAAPDAVEELLRWIRINLDDEAQGRLIEQLATKPANAMDDEDGAARPSLDPTQTKRTAPGQAKAMDAMVARVLAKQFPGIEKIDVHPMETAGRRKPAIASDSAHLKSLAERFPGIDRIGFA
jgi:hypothetical protein